jgi:hypothetical protein
MKKSEDQAVLELTRRLRETYLVEVRRIEQERLADLDPTKKAYTKVVFDRIRQIFDAYANKRGPLVIRLSFLVGFPDPDPASTRVPDSSRPLQKKRFDESKRLREQIVLLDKQYDASVVNELNSLRESNEEAFTRLKVDIEELRSKAEQQAIDEARKQINTNRDEVRSLIIDSPSVVLESVGKKKVAFAPASKPKMLKTPAVNLSDGREEIKVDLDIWMAQKGYVLGSREKGVDVTLEFILWRKMQLDGH